MFVLSLNDVVVIGKMLCLVVIVVFRWVCGCLCWDGGGFGVLVGVFVCGLVVGEGGVG